MAFPRNTKEDRWESARWRNSEPPTTDAMFSFLHEPLRSVPTAQPPNTTTALNDARASLQRRFTTNTLVQPIGSRRKPTEPPVPDIPFAFAPKASPSEKKKQEYEYLRQKQAQRQAQIELMSSESKREEMELHRLSQELGFPSKPAGLQSEPTTPPEYRESGFPTSIPKSNRFSMSNVVSPPPNLNRRSFIESQVSSPPSERARAYQALTAGLPSNPETRHNSDEDELDEPVFEKSHRSAAALNRNSMPVTRRDHTRNGFAEPDSTLGHVDTHAFLFGEELEKPKNATPSFLQMNTDDNFPILIRQDRGSSHHRIGSMNAMDSLAPASSDGVPHSSTWSDVRRSFDPQAAAGLASRLNFDDSPPHGASQVTSPGPNTPTKNSLNRHSMGPTMGGKMEPFTTVENKRSSFMKTTTPPNDVNSPPSSTAPKLQSSWSTSDVPTLKSTANNNAAVAPGTQPTQAASDQQRFHNHNVSLGRIPAGATQSNRHSRELSGEISQDENIPPMPSLQSALQASAATFGSNPHSAAMSESSPTHFAQAGLPQFNNQNFYGGYNGTQNGIQSLTNGMQSLSTSGHQQWNNPMAVYQNFSGYGPYQQYGPTRGVSDSQARVIQQRRTQNGEEHTRFTNISLENLQGEIYALCKDQHGCRYLQKKLEEDKPEQTAMIFAETKEHMVELMTDPFGNYLCQKLLEHTNDDQHTVLINNAAPHMVKIALNQHGTRALQKMIEYVSTDEQVETVIIALKDQVVPMIQDLNGNHVIQKCLNRLSPEHAQFIFDSVAEHCVVVGTHRHGCCVIQRCIDHASGDQKSQLVAAITRGSIPLVQDPFGNYVLQYIFDQGEDSFSQALCQTFLGRIAPLSKQKFSSNVIEKCIRMADTDTRHKMIEELIGAHDFDKLADDAFANYVIQTAWDHCDPVDEARLVDKIRPVLPRMRHKPYGRRLQTRLNDRDKRLGIHVSGTVTPVDVGSPESLSGVNSHGMHRQMSSQDSSIFSSPPGSSYGISMSQMGSPQNYGASAMPINSDYTSPQFQRPVHFGNGGFPNMQQYQMQQHMQQPFSSYGRPPGMY